MADFSSGQSNPVTPPADFPSSGVDVAELKGWLLQHPDHYSVRFGAAFNEALLVVYDGSQPVAAINLQTRRRWESDEGGTISA